MLIGARITHGTMSLDKQRACPAVWVEAEAVFFAEEVVEREAAGELLLGVENAVCNTGG